MIAQLAHGQRPVMDHVLDVVATWNERRETMAAMDLPGAADDETAATTSIERAATGDQAAFAEFYDDVAPAVHGTVLKVLRNRALAEEVTQDVFFELWRIAGKYDRSKGTPKAWACTVAHRRAVDRVRSVEAARSRDEADARLAVVDHDTVADEVATNLDRSEVVGALARLTESQREAVRLAYYGGLTYREVAEALGVPEGTIKTRIRDGLIRLRDEMGVTT